jgi:hypothetical protein
LETEIPLEMSSQRNCLSFIEKNNAFGHMILPSLLLLLTVSPINIESTISSPTIEVENSNSDENIEPILYRAQEGFVNFGLCETKSNRSEAFRMRSPSLNGKGDEENRFGEVAASPNSQNLVESGIHSLIDPAIHLGTGIFFGSATLVGGIGWAIYQFSPWASTFGNECLLSSHIFWTVSTHSFAQAFKTSPFLSLFFKRIPSSHSTWDLNKKLLSEVPAPSSEDKELIAFLQRRWLAKITGCYPFLANWMCRCFGISFQLHPESTNSYARDPATKYSVTYKKRIEEWKQALPHPPSFPLILTRPSSVRDYLPSYFEILQDEKIEHSVERLAHLMHSTDAPVIVDLTSVLPNDTLDRKQWLDAWHSYENEFSKLCSEHRLDLDQSLCIQRVQQRDVGGIRLLPFLSSSKENIEKHYQYMLEWISRFGLTANRIELDRSLLTSDISSSEENSSIPISLESKEQWLSLLNSIDQHWRSNHPQKTLMFKGTLQVLKGLCTTLPEAKWEAVMNSPTRSSAAELSFTKIKEQLLLLIQEENNVSFHDVVSHIEQIHADLTSLLEIFNPFTAEDFLDIYRRHLTTIPNDLQPLTGYAIHSSGMTSLGAIFKVLERTLGRPLRILFGENTYFEIANLVERVSQASPILESSEKDWKEVDLLLVQFNPTVKRINFKVTEYQATEYHVERIGEILHDVLRVREGKPISVMIDCTLDFSDSTRVGELLTEFQQEIENGDLNVICYRSGLKFDLFGMDNYCGAPFVMVHNRDAKWFCFDPLLTDPALRTDQLSLNWFCLAYEYAAPYLELYRQQIFDNTRALLNKIPSHLFNEKNPSYRVIPIDSDVDPSFIDIKIFGPLHAFRGGMFGGGFLTIKCMEAGFPLLYRPGIGFHHPNLAVLFGKECTTVRLTLGLDPAQIDVIVRCMEKIDRCNGLQPGFRAL